MNEEAPVPSKKKKKKSGIPTGNAGEYFVMGELLRRGYDAQLADRNTKGYDLLVGRPEGKNLHKVQVKTVRTPPWYVKTASFENEAMQQITIYVLLGGYDAINPIRYFITRNSDLATLLLSPRNWKDNAFMRLKFVEQYEDDWDGIARMVDGSFENSGRENLENAPAASALPMSRPTSAPSSEAEGAVVFLEPPHDTTGEV